MSKLPEGIETVHLVDGEGRRWGTMSREEYEDATESADRFQALIRAELDKH